MVSLSNSGSQFFVKIKEFMRTFDISYKNEWFFHKICDKSN